MITHDLGQIEHADVILHIEHGVLIESGSHHDLMSAGGTYAQLVRSEYTQEETLD